MVKFLQESRTRLAGRSCPRQPIAESLNSVDIRVAIEEDGLSTKVPVIKVEMLGSLALTGGFRHSDETIILRYRSQISFARSVYDILENFADRNCTATVHVSWDELDFAKLIVFRRRAANSLKLR